MTRGNKARQIHPRAMNSEIGQLIVRASWTRDAFID